MEVAPGSSVRVAGADLPDAAPSEAHAVEILEFVDLAAVDPLLFDGSYLVGPGEGGARPDAWLRATQRPGGRRARPAPGQREPRAVAGVGECPALEMLHYPDGVRDWREVDGLPPETTPDEQELAVVVALLERLTAPWQPDKSCDRNGDELRQRVAAKTATTAASAGPGALEGYADLLPALEASLAAGPLASGTGRPGDYPDARRAAAPHPPGQIALAGRRTWGRSRAQRGVPRVPTRGLAVRPGPPATTPADTDR